MVENLEKKELWDKCGINPDVVICIFRLFDKRAWLTMILSHLHTIFPTLTFMNSYHLTFSTKSSKGPLRTILWHGLENTLKMAMESQKSPRLWLILIRGMYVLHMLCVLHTSTSCASCMCPLITLIPLAEFLLYLLIQGSIDSSREGALISGPAMIQKCS